MADVLSALTNWSATASSNQPTDATQIGANLADNLQMIQAVVRGDLATKGTDIASSAAPDVGAVVGLYHDITGSNTITGLGSSATAGIWKILQFDGSPVLKHSTALAMVNAADVTAQPGAVGVFFCEASNQWRNVSFHRATAGALVAAATTTQAGVMEVATASEALAGTSDTVAITPSALDSVLGIVKLATGTVSNTAIADVTMTAYTAYANKMVVFKNFVPATDAAFLWLRTSTDGGSTFDATGYGYGIAAGSSGGATGVGSVADTKILLHFGNSDNATATGGISGAVKLFGTTTAQRTHVSFQSGGYNSDLSAYFASNGQGSSGTAQDTDAVRFLFSTGNIGSGSWDLYGFN